MTNTTTPRRAPRLTFRRGRCTHKATAWCKYGRGFTIVQYTGETEFSLVGMGLDFGKFSSMSAAKAKARSVWSMISLFDVTPEQCGGQRVIR